MAEELKACPFCGGDANAAPESQHYPGCYFDVLASLRAAKGGDISLAPEVLRAWNRRAQLPSQGGEAAQVVGRVHHNSEHAEPVRAVLNSVGRQLPDNAPLYTHPADQVAEGYRAVPMELLKLIEQSWRVPNGLPKSVSEHVQEKIENGLAELRALLATPSPQ